MGNYFQKDFLYPTNAGKLTLATVPIIYRTLQQLCQLHKTLLLTKISFAMEYPLTQPSPLSLRQNSFSFRLQEFEAATILYATFDK